MLLADTKRDAESVEDDTIRINDRDHCFFFAAISNTIATVANMVSNSSP